MNIRLKAFLISIPQFVGFVLISLFLFLLLFHIAVLSFPVLAFMWTFWGFSVFTVLTGVKIEVKHVLLFDFLLLLCILGLIIFNIESFKVNFLSIIFLISILSIIFLYIYLTFKLSKRYLPLLKDEFIRVFNKITRDD